MPDPLRQGAHQRIQAAVRSRTLGPDDPLSSPPRWAEWQSLHGPTICNGGAVEPEELGLQQASGAKLANGSGAMSLPLLGAPLVGPHLWCRADSAFETEEQVVRIAHQLSRMLDHRWGGRSAGVVVTAGNSHMLDFRLLQARRR